MYERFTDRARKVMQLANQEAHHFKHEYIGTEHLLLGLVLEGSGVAANVLKNLDIDLRKVRKEVEKILVAGVDMPSASDLPHTPKARKVLENAIEEARLINHNYVGTEHLLLSLVREEESTGAQVLLNLGLTLQNVREEVLNLLGHNLVANPSSSKVESPSQKKTPALDAYGLDLTQLVRQGKLAPIVGRRDELEQVLLVLGCRGRKNPLLIGEPGVGKAAIVKGLACLTVEPACPEVLRDRRLIAVDLVRLVLTTKDAEHFQELVRAMVGESRRAKDVILFFNDMTIFTIADGATTRPYNRLAFRSALFSGDIQCIGLTTPEQYRTSIAHDPLLERHFQPIVIQPPSREETIAILRHLRQVYEESHQVLISDDALEAAATLARIDQDRCLPAKAINLIDQAGALVRLRHVPQPPPELTQLEAKVAQLTQEKEAAVAVQDFEKAANLFEEVRKLKKRINGLNQERKEQTRQVGTVDKDTITEVVHTMS